MIESPVCTPMGSKFSIEQMTTTLSAWSRMTSSSYSFHPTTDCSSRISETGLVARPCAATWRRSSSSKAMPVPPPPMMKLGRQITGYPTSSATASASSSAYASPDFGTLRPISIIAALNFDRSSAVWIASTLAPISSTPNSSSTPASCSSIARLSAVWPPSVGSSASGRSRSMIRRRLATSSGST